MIAVTGRRSAIIAELAEITGETIVDARESAADRYVFAAGLLRNKRVDDQTDQEIAESYEVNLGQHMDLCEAVLDSYPEARICVIGSESAYKGSFDGTYAAAKQGLHAYVERRAVGPKQQLVAVAPHIIIDAGMTLRRHDYHQMQDLGRCAPRERWITAREVAKVIHWLLWSDEGAWLNNTVLRLSGGARTGASPIAASGRG